MIAISKHSLNYSKHSDKCTFYTLRFGCSFAEANTIKPQGVKGAFIRMLTAISYYY